MTIKCHKYTLDIDCASGDVIVVESDSPRFLQGVLTDYDHEGSLVGLAIRSETPSASMIEFVNENVYAKLEELVNEGGK